MHYRNCEPQKYKIKIISDYNFYDDNIFLPWHSNTSFYYACYSL